jgi:RNA polymerase I-specific transcription initiation factor RRN11
MMQPVFTPPPQKHEISPSTSTIKFHTRRLIDILHLSIQRNDSVRAQRAWTILQNQNLGHWKLSGGDEDERRPETLRRILIRQSENREEILLEIVLTLLQDGQARKALNELEL